MYCPNWGTGTEVAFKDRTPILILCLMSQRVSLDVQNTPFPAGVPSPQSHFLHREPNKDIRPDDITSLYIACNCNCSFEALLEARTQTERPKHTLLYMYMDEDDWID